MKKNEFGFSRYLGKKQKLLLIMKLTFLLTVACILQVSATVYSQATKFNFELKNQRIQDVLREIEDNSEFRFFYQREQVDVEQSVTLKITDQTVEEILPELFKGQEVAFDVRQDNLILIKPQRAISESSTEFYAQQQNTVTGKVTDSSNQPLPGVSVVVKGTTTGVVTNNSGNYAIGVTENATLQFSFVGMKMQEIAVTGKTTINVTLIEEIVGIEEVVTIGYGTQRKVEVTSAAVSVKSKDFVSGSVKDAGQLLQGKVAGLTIGTPSGDPGATSEIILRGTSTLFSSISPLVLIDGIPGDLNTVAPEDIESIDVLKDGSAAAIYGTRGTNGVILINTKTHNGSIGSTIEYNGYISTQSFINLPDMLTADQYRSKLASGTSGFQNDGSSTDWVKEISRDTPFSHNHNITVRGGNAKTNYVAVLGYRDLQGVIITSENKTINSRVNLNHSMMDDKLKVGISYINNVENNSAYFDNVAFRNAVRYNPTSPVYNEDGTYFENFGPTENYNPVAMIKETFGDSQLQASRLSGSITWLPISDLHFKILASRSETNGVTGYGLTKQHYTTTQMGKNGYAYKSDTQSTDKLFEFTGEYIKSMNSSKLTLLAGYSYQDFLNQNSRMDNFDFPSGTYSYIDKIGVGNALKIGQAVENSEKYVSNLIGFFGRANYNYKEKYLLMASLRYEGASQFVGTEKPWGLFPAVSVGWRITEEDFMKNAAFISNLKLRAGYGVTGTSPDQLFLGVSRLGYSGSFLINGQWQPSLVPVSNPNPYLRWEEKKETNIGLDFAFLKGKISGSIDVYNRETDGLLFNYQVPSPPNLYKTTTANVGVMNNKGFEMLVNVIPVQSEKFTWNTGVTFSMNNNKLVSLENDLYKTTNDFFDDGRTPTPIGDISHRIQVGQPIGNFYGYKVIDVTDDGHWIYEDGDGKPFEGTPDPAKDRKVIGNGLPKSYLSWNNTFTYGSFDLGINMRGAFGFEIMNAQRMLHENPGFDNYNQLNSAYDKVFGKSVLNRDVEVECNSYYVEKGDYWKIDNITLGYNYNLTKVNHIKSARLFISAQNAFTFTGYKGMDPEVTRFGTTGSQRLTPGYDDREKYPTSRIFTLGLNITFN